MEARYIKIMTLKPDSPMGCCLDLKASRNRMFGKWIRFTDQQKNHKRIMQFHDYLLVGYDIYIDAYVLDDKMFTEHYEKNLLTFTTMVFASENHKLVLEVYACETDIKKWYKQYMINAPS